MKYLKESSPREDDIAQEMKANADKIIKIPINKAYLHVGHLDLCKNIP
jgi:hypothetical protein